MWTKVVAPTILVSLLWIVVSSGTTFYINWLFESQSRVLRENVATIQAAAGIQDIVWRLRVLAMQGPQTREAGSGDQLPELEAAFQKHFSTATRTATTAEEKELVAEVGGQFARYLAHVRQGLSVGAAASPDASGYLAETVRLAHAVVTPCKRLLEVNGQVLAESTLRSKRLGSAVTMARIAVLATVPAIGIFFGVLVARGLRRSISQISVTLKDATGKLERELGRVDIGPTGDLPGLEQQVQTVSTQIKKVVDELHDARREIIRAERLAAVGELAAGVAHEIRNPLTSIKLLIQTAAQRHPDRAWSERQYQVIQEEVARMERTVQGLLDFARPPQLHRLRHDLRDTLQRAVNLIEGRARQERVAIAVHLPSQPVAVEGDPELLHQVFVNLLLNGIESMADGGSLSVGMECAPEADGVCRAVFRDSGSGIPESVMERIFEPFITTKKHGTGLGLAVSRRIVMEHGGILSAANRPDGGAAFVVELPTARLDPSDRGGAGLASATLGIPKDHPKPQEGTLNA